MSYLRNRILSFGYAIKGLKQAFQKEVHFKLFVLIALLVIGVAAYFNISRIEWVFVMSAMALVICLELVNSAVEKLCDLVHPEKNLSVKFIKDVMAAAVFLASLYAAIVGLIVFGPYIKSLF